MSRWLTTLEKLDPEMQEAIDKFREAKALSKLVYRTLILVRLLGLRLMAFKIEQDDLLEHPGDCPNCQRRLESKGQKSRKVLTLLGYLLFWRKIYRCPAKCHIGQIAPTDWRLQLQPGQKTCLSVKKLACLLAVFVPYKPASILLGLLTGVEVSANAIWDWVQEFGQKAIDRLEAQLANIEEYQEQMWREALPEELKELLMLIGSDGVMVPFRPDGGNPEGKTVWREVKVGVVAWLKEHTTKKGERMLRPVKRRFVAYLGEVEWFKPRLWLAALELGILKAKRAVWVSDGGRGYWGVYDAYFARLCTPILDFYHAAQNLYKGAKAWLDGRTQKAQNWFRKQRRKLRDGKAQEVLKTIEKTSKKRKLSDSARKELKEVHSYLDKHIEHIDYKKFEEEGFPLGSGMVESACKWLIQQRFKGVGMRWGEEGFTKLLHLRLAWVNETYFELFEEEERE